MKRIVSAICCLVLVIVTIVPVHFVFADKEELSKPQGTGYELEPNNTAAKADWIYGDRAVFGKIQSDSDIDYWKMKAPGNGTLSATLSVPKGVNYQLQMNDAAGKILAQSDSESTVEEIKTVSVEKDQWYYYTVTSSDNSFDKKSYYMIKAEYMAEGSLVNPDQNEPNNTPQDATQIHKGENLEATIHEQTDVDYYRFKYDLASTINLSLSNIPKEMDLDLYLLDASFKLIAKSIHAKNANEQINYQGDPGTYFVRVESSNRSKLVANKYKLNVEITTIPVILIPGIGGSRLTKTETNNPTPVEAWVDLLGMAVNEEYHIKNLSLMPKKQGSDQVVQRNSQISIAPEEGDSGFRAIEYLSYGKLKNFAKQYSDMSQTLQSMGYQKGVDLFGLPYDWRLSSSKNSIFLKQEIDRALQASGAKQVQLVAHSMGGILVKETLLSNPAYQQKVKRIIYLGTPFLGSPRAYQALRTGYDFGIPFFSNESAKQICQYSPATFELLPSKQYVKSENYLFLDNNSQVTPFDYKDIFTNPKVSSGIYQPLLKSAEALHTKWDTKLLQVPQYAIVGMGASTLTGFKYLTSSNQLIPYYYANGDGTVPLVSAEFSHRDMKKQYHTVGEHADLPQKEYVINQVTKLLQGVETVQDGLWVNQDAKNLSLDYLVIYREDGKFPEVSFDIGGKTHKIQKQASNEVGVEVESHEQNRVKVEYHGNAVVVFLPTSVRKNSIRVKRIGTEQEKSEVIIERIHVDSDERPDHVSKHSIQTNEQTVIE